MFPNRTFFQVPVPLRDLLRNWVLILVKPLFNTQSFILILYLIKLITLPFGYRFKDYFQIYFRTSVNIDEVIASDVIALYLASQDGFYFSCYPVPPFNSFPGWYLLSQPIKDCVLNNGFSKIKLKLSNTEYYQLYII